MRRRWAILLASLAINCVVAIHVTARELRRRRERQIYGSM